MQAELTFRKRWTDWQSRFSWVENGCFYQIFLHQIPDQRRELSKRCPNLEPVEEKRRDRISIITRFRSDGNDQWDVVPEVCPTVDTCHNPRSPWYEKRSWNEAWILPGKKKKRCKGWWFQGLRYIYSLAFFFSQKRYDEAMLMPVWSKKPKAVSLAFKQEALNDEPMEKNDNKTTPVVWKRRAFHGPCLHWRPLFQALLSPR